MNEKIEQVLTNFKDEVKKHTTFEKSFMYSVPNTMNSWTIIHVNMLVNVIQTQSCLKIAYQMRTKDVEIIHGEYGRWTRTPENKKRMTRPVAPRAVGAPL